MVTSRRVREREVELEWQSEVASIAKDDELVVFIWRTLGKSILFERERRETGHHLLDIRISKPVADHD
jgi:hypothetical protein